MAALKNCVQSAGEVKQAVAVPAERRRQKTVSAEETIREGRTTKWIYAFIILR